MLDNGESLEINNMYIKLLKTGKNIFNETKYLINDESAAKFINYSNNLNNFNKKVMKMLKLAEKYSVECLITADNIKKCVNDNSNTSKITLMNSLYVFDKNISWSDATDSIECKEKLIKKVDNFITSSINPIKNMKHKSIEKSSNINSININNLYGKELGFNINLPTIKSLNEMQSALHWYEGDVNNPKGVYICIITGFYIQIPFPNLIDVSKDHNRLGSVKCKLNTLNKCLEHRTLNAKKINAKIRDCTFAHIGDRYNKIGTVFRCPNKPRLGNHEYLNADIESATSSDIKSILLHSLPDILLSALWFSTKNINKPDMILTNIDIC